MTCPPFPCCPLCKAAIKDGSLEEVGRHFADACPRISLAPAFGTARLGT